VSKEERDENVALERPVMLGQHSVLVRSESGGGTVRVFGPNGSEALSIEITSEGATLRLARGLAIDVEGPLSFAADSISIRGRDSLQLASDGDARVAVAGELAMVSRSTQIETTHGDVKLDANDDIIFRGERVRVNC
jgi:hypothetical protein